MSATYDKITLDRPLDLDADASVDVEPCRRYLNDTGHDIWFSEDELDQLDAKRICRHCPLRSQCLDVALDHDIKHGIWGGLTGRQRTNLKYWGIQPRN